MWQCYIGPIAHSVEHVAVNRKVDGSKPPGAVHTRCYNTLYEWTFIKLPKNRDGC
jgi:hypothetical protein